MTEEGLSEIHHRGPGRPRPKGHLREGRGRRGPMGFVSLRFTAVAPAASCSCQSIQFHFSRVVVLLGMMQAAVAARTGRPSVLGCLSCFAGCHEGTPKCFPSCNDWLMSWCMHATMQLSNELLQSHRGGFVATTDCYSQDIGIFVGGGGGGGEEVRRNWTNSCAPKGAIKNFKRFTTTKCRLWGLIKNHDNTLSSDSERFPWRNSIWSKVVKE